MLHSALPRAYLGYQHPHLTAGSFFEEAVIAAQQQQQQQHHPYYQMQQLDPESYQRVLAWDTSSTSTTTSTMQLRAATPCPLDLSLKPPPTPGSVRTDEYEPIEVDDEEDRRSREEARSRHSSYRDEDVVVDDLDSQRSCSSAHSYQQLPSAALPYIPGVTSELERTPVKGTMLLEAERLMSLGYQHQQLLHTPQQQQHAAPMTPPSTPSPPQLQHQPQAQRRKREEDQQQSQHTPKQTADKPPRAKKKHARKLKFDEDTSSPVSGTVILGPDEAVVTGDIDPAFNIVEVTEEARAELAKIENRLGPYQCKLCRQLHDDAFQLAQHRCSRIAHVEYRCPECDKRFSCPANLASHRRWHKPRPGATNSNTATTGTTTTTTTSSSNSSSSSGSEESSSESLACTSCDAKFSRQAALRKHVAAQHPCITAEQNNNNNNNNQEMKSGTIEMA